MVNHPRHWNQKITLFLSGMACCLLAAIAFYAPPQEREPNISVKEANLVAINLPSEVTEPLNAGREAIEPDPELVRHIQFLEEGLSSKDQHIQTLQEQAFTLKLKFEEELKNITAEKTHLLAIIAEHERSLAIQEKTHNLTLEEVEKYQNLTNELQESLTALENEKKNLQDSLKTLQHNFSRFEYSKNQSEKIHQENLAILNQQVSELTKELDRIKKENATLANAVKVQEDLSGKYQDEVTRRINAENLLQALTAALQDQKMTLQKIEKSRQELVAELAQAKNSYSELIKDVSAAKHTFIDQPTLLPGVKAVLANAKTTHVVQAGDTLFSISSKYYGTPQKWNDIYQANIEKVPNKDALKPGLTLNIP